MTYWRIEDFLPAAEEAARLIVEAYERGGRVISFGNEAAPWTHSTSGELFGRFEPRAAPLLPSR